jgi:RsiW-degrading membrane proteinase PrsW (M82 family)
MPTTFILGRDTSADITIADPSVSRRHAEIVLLDDTRLFVRDLGSANGSTLIRGGARTPLAREVLGRGDDVQFGDATLTFDALRDILLDKLGRLPEAPPPDPVLDRVPAPVPEPAPARDRRDEGRAPRRDARGDAHGATPDPERSRRPQLGDFVPISGLRLLGPRGMLAPAILFSLLLMRMMWLLRQPTAEAMASFVVEFCAVLATLGFVVVYRLCGKRKPLKVILAVMVAEAALMSMHDTLAKPFCEPTGARLIILRRMVADGAIKIPVKRPAAPSQQEHLHHAGKDLDMTLLLEDAQPAEAGGAAAAEGQYLKVARPGFLALWWAYFCCAGLIEELEKMLPVFALIWLTFSSRRADANKWGVSEPLDAIVYAAATALAFILLETLFGNSYVGAALQSAREKGTLATQAYLSFPLAILRTVKGMAGHIAYSGYFAYFVGLGLMRPRHRERYWIGGWIGASIIHGLFNASPGSVSSLVSVTAFFLLLAVILKARQISPARDENFATRAVRV